MRFISIRHSFLFVILSFLFNEFIKNLWKNQWFEFKRTATCACAQWYTLNFVPFSKKYFKVKGKLIKRFLQQSQPTKVATVKIYLEFHPIVTLAYILQDGVCSCRIFTNGKYIRSRTIEIYHFKLPANYNGDGFNGKIH